MWNMAAFNEISCVTHICMNVNNLSSQVQSGVSQTANQGVAGSSSGQVTFFRWDLVMKNISRTILILPLIQEGQLSVTCRRMGTKYW